MIKVEKIIPQKTFLDVRLSGPCDGIDFYTYMPPIQAALVHYHFERLLIDCSKVIYRGKVTVEHLFAEYLAQRMPRSVRIAIIAPVDLSKEDLHLEIAASNRGVSLRCFWTLQDGVEWLSEA